MGLVDDALARQRSLAPKTIDYTRMELVIPKQRAALTRAIKTHDPERIAKVCKDAVRIWNEIGAWPDDWARWQIALDDSLPFHKQVRIEHL